MNTEIAPVIDQNVLPANHSYQKDAKAFIRGLKRKEKILKDIELLKQPVLNQLGVQKEYQLWLPEHQHLTAEYNNLLETTGTKREIDKVGKGFHNLNRRLNKLKWGFWACYPAGTTEYYEIYPENK